MAFPDIETAKSYIPLLDDPATAERRLHENFKLLIALLKDGATGTFTGGAGETVTVTKGIITAIVP